MEKMCTGATGATAMHKFGKISYRCNEADGGFMTIPVNGPISRAVVLNPKP